MEQTKIEEILKKAGNAVSGLPEHLQIKAFELAVSMLRGESPAPDPSAPIRIAAPEVAFRRASSEGETPEVADLLRACKRNPDRYLVFTQDLEFRGEPATTASLTERFRTYRQDMPKLPARDLGDMVAKGMLEQLGKGRDAAYILKRKGRERLAQLSAAVAGE